MISIAGAELEAWVAAFFWPLTRVLGLMAIAPLFGNRSVPARVRIGLALLVTFLLAPGLGEPPALAPGSGAGLLVAARELVIGLAMGFAMRIVFAAIDLAGELAGLQMGLGFASLYDPQRASDNPVLAAFLGVVATLAFLSFNGHLMLIAVLAGSFELLPVASAPLGAPGMHTLVLWGGKIFFAGLLLALPLLAALLVANLALGMLARAAPQLNLFAIGFPLTLGVGLAGFALLLPYLEPSLERLFEDGFSAMLRFAAGARPR